MMPPTALMTAAMMLGVVTEAAVAAEVGQEPPDGRQALGVVLDLDRVVEVRLITYRRLDSSRPPTLLRKPTSAGVAWWSVSPGDATRATLAGGG